MKRAIVIAVILSAAVSCSRGVYHIGPEGDDSASGTALNPLATFDGALARIREDRSSGRFSGTAVIVLKEGEYRISEPVMFGPADTSITVKGRGMGKSVVSGGEILPAFREEDDHWVSDLSGSMAGRIDFQQLYVGGQPAILARTPNAGAFFRTGAVEEILPDPVPVSGAVIEAPAVQRMKLSSTMMESLGGKLLADLSHVRVTFLHSWNLTRRCIRYISPEDSLLYVTGSRMHPWNPLDRCSQCYFDNDKAFLDAPGEWFFDRESMELLYVPREGEDIRTVRAVVPVAEKLIGIEGTADARVHGISFEGISFRDCGYVMRPEGEDARQAASHTDAAITVDFADNVSFTGCEIDCAGCNGIWMRNSCRNSSLCCCYLHDLGIGGVRIGTVELPENEETDLTGCITVDNNVIRSGGRILETGVGVILFNASDCVITHNDISDFYYSGVSVGWRWGYVHSPSKRNTVSYNHIHNIGQGVLSDMGGVYTLGPSEGTVVSHNRIHDIFSYGYGGWGLYTDEGSTGIRMEDNLVYNCKSSCFHQHYGRDNVIANNIFVDGQDAQLEATRVEDHLSFTFCHNIICYATGDMYGIHWDTANSDVRENLYWKYGGQVSFNGLSLEEWQHATGKDMGSVIADPGFRDISAGDFTITDEAAVASIGFRPFDWREAGVN